MKMETSMERIELLESKVAELEKIIATLLPKPTPSNSLLGHADIYQYKNSLLLVSKDKERGTYGIKDRLKQIGAKWASVNIDQDKLSGWMILGICKDITLEEAIESIIVKLKDVNVTLEYENKGVLNKD